MRRQTGALATSRRTNLTRVRVEQAQGRGGLGLTVLYCFAKQIPRV